MRPVTDFLRFLGEGKFMIQRAKASGAHIFYPRTAEPRTGDADLEWVEASGRGTVYGTTVQRNKPPAADTNIVLVDLAEGPRMLSRVDGIAADAVRIGMAVQARITDEGSGPFVVFDPAEGAA